MQVISSKEINQLYKKCGLNPYEKYEIITTINTGTLNNRLNTNFVSSKGIKTGVSDANNVNLLEMLNLY